MPEGPSGIRELTKAILTNWYSRRGNYSKEEINKKIKEKLSKENFIRTRIKYELQKQKLNALPVADAIFVLDACQRKDITQLKRLISPCPGNFDFSYI